MQSHGPAVEQLAQLMKPRHPRDVALDGRAAGYAIANPFAETAAPTHRLLVQLETACRALANWAQEKRPLAAVGKALVNNLDLTSGTVIAHAENDLDRLRIPGHDARRAQPRDADRRKILLK